MSKWTPGPWEFRANEDNEEGTTNRLDIAGSICTEGDDWYLARVWNDGPRGHGRHNAHLMAAAPDLYETLTALLNRYTALISSGDCGHWNVEQDAEVVLARAALAKATQVD